MLTLSRRPGETIIIDVGGHTVVIIVKVIQGNKVMIGVDADASVVIQRGELKALRDQQEVASK